MIPPEVSTLFDELSERTSADREAVLGSVPEHIARDVRSLLEAFDLSPEFLVGDAGRLGDELQSSRSRDVGSWPRPDQVGAGVQIGSFTIHREIGRGGMGIVYEALQSEPSRRVAIKVLAPGVWSEAQRKRFRREAEALGRLQHPGIATIFEARAASMDGQPSELVPFIAMELIDGVPIDQYCAEQSLDPRAIVTLARDVAEALEHAHLRGVVHSDLSPSNILVERSGRTRIVDFGIARLLDPANGPATIGATADRILGKWAYMAPEQALGSGSIDRRSDIYALGSVLYTLLAGGPWLETAGRAVFELLRSLEREVVPPVHIPPCQRRRDLAAIVATATHRQPARRYQTAGELHADLSRWLAGQRVMAREPGVVERSRDFVLQHKLLTAVTASTLVALSAGLFIAANEAQRASEAERATSRTLQQVLSGIVDSLQQSRAALGTRAAILANLRPQVDHLLASMPDDPSVRLAASRFYRELALVVGYPYTPNLGRFDEAIEMLRISMKISAPSGIAREPDEDLARYTAEAMSLVAAALHTHGRTAEALGDLVGLVDACRDRERTSGSPRVWQLIRFGVAVHFAHAMIASGSEEEAAQLVQLYGEEVARAEAIEGRTREIGRMWHSVARAASEIGAQTVVISASRRARAAFIATEESDGEILQWIGDTYRYEGVALRATGELVKAEFAFGESLSKYASSQAVRPLRSDTQSVRCLALLERSLARSSLGNLSAVEDAREAVSIRRERAHEEPEIPGLKRSLADAIETLAHVISELTELGAAGGAIAREELLLERSRCLEEAEAIRAEASDANRTATARMRSSLP